MPPQVEVAINPVVPTVKQGAPAEARVTKAIVPDAVRFAFAVEVAFIPTTA